MENMPWVVQWYGDGCDCLMNDAKMCMMIRGAADRLWWMKIWCREVEEMICDNRWFTVTPLSLRFPQILRSLLHKIMSWGQRSCYHLLCIAGGIILRWSDTNTGKTLWQVPQQWWKLRRKAVHGVYIKWQYTGFVIYSCFFFNSPSELTFWITPVSLRMSYEHVQSMFYKRANYYMLKYVFLLWVYLRGWKGKKGAYKLLIFIVVVGQMMVLFWDSG